ncbi:MULTISPECIES: DUF6158 family protein [Streptomycetaceae]|uniref:Uncharacterized protein n=1 Tax=Streptantibioticus cattleyicolor (strain ATCC 35852 / DSM 46488 / JCM 4925 / NBRC 14057 / NRRL 8057) TaxID=1003195 RepID=F8JRS3_STREN|nr:MULTISPECIES: DUF6158 family protein [Streptomycetaceae]AEW97254.1 hypothetical protein SCATT_48830 [Streptantibioticus cattleyicolor NRRL 8057 = DSM 46488]MYS61709.1 hypothetical protein [Streptomyces sp. SID5468]CCB77577.1 conserved protein of unknown function [Streptantibioticus cattleyicolor NRRL 8057 = DSM 46488]
MAEHDSGVPAERLDDRVLLRELEAIHRTRHETLLHGSAEALATHTARMRELEAEYLRRHPARVPAAGRTRAGARARATEE